MLLDTIFVLEGKIVVWSPGHLSILDLLNKSINALLFDPPDQSGVFLELGVEIYQGRQVLSEYLQFAYEF